MGKNIKNDLISNRISIKDKNVIYGDSIYDSILILSYIGIELFHSDIYIYTDRQTKYEDFNLEFFIEKNDLLSLKENSILIVDFDNLWLENIDFIKTSSDKVIYVDNNNIISTYHREIIDSHIKSYDGKFYFFYKSELFDLIHHTDYEKYIKVFKFFLRKND